MVGSDGDVDEPREAQALVEPAEAQKETPDGTSAIDRSRAAVWLERFLYVELGLALLLFIAESAILDSDSLRCDEQNGGSMVTGIFEWSCIGLVIAGVVSYLARLGFPNRCRWFHLAFVLLLAAAVGDLIYLVVWSFGIGMSDSNYCY